MAWALLILGGVFEVGFTTCLRFVDGFRNLPWTAGFLVSVTLSMGLLEVASRSIPMGTAYAVWGGIGAIGTVLVGIMFFGEASAPIRVILIFGIVACIAGLKLVS
ncbi:multidrug efflux SMR transporter [Sphingomonas sp.]|jgi:quaternary ammonium compound-resistance protein SugE|uniref:DMT family transporter n=1 Tax=Sphingomonas sp. TaxID=28214 RepID=UPI002DE5B438|nr:multidrug efflux SMR transporter [Sphingomonas sp.]